MKRCNIREYTEAVREHYLQASKKKKRDFELIYKDHRMTPRALKDTVRQIVTLGINR